MKQTILDNIRRALGREAGAAVAARPQVYPPRAAGTPESEIERFLAELKLLSADGQALAGESALQAALHALVQAEQVRKATLWSTPLLRHLRLAERLQALGVELVSPQAGKLALAGCDLGVTEADFALPETGTLGLRSSTKKPRAVSLVPRIHLALLTPAALRPDLHEVFAEARRDNYLVLITGPSRTSDIELTVTLGVHGPQKLAVWVMMDGGRAGA